MQIRHIGITAFVSLAFAQPALAEETDTLTPVPLTLYGREIDLSGLADRTNRLSDLSDALITVSAGGNLSLHDGPIIPAPPPIERDFQWGGLILIQDGGTLTIVGELAVDPKITLFSLTPIPEPDTWALLLAGLGLVGFSARRRLMRVRS